MPQDNEEAIEPNNKQDCAFLNEIDEQDESFNRRFNIELDRETKQEQRQKCTKMPCSERHKRATKP